MADPKYHELIKNLYGLPDIQVRDAERAKLTGVSRTVAWNWEKTGRFPKRRKNSGNHVTWSMAELMEWNDRDRGRGDGT